MSKIRFFEETAPHEKTPLVRAARVFLLPGVWFLVGLAGLCVFAKPAG